MPQKSRRKKKYTGQKPRITPSTPSRAAEQPAQRVMQRETAARPRPGAAKSGLPLPSIPSNLNVIRELKSIGIVAGILLVILIVLSFVLT